MDYRKLLVLASKVVLRHTVSRSILSIVMLYVSMSAIIFSITNYVEFEISYLSNIVVFPRSGGQEYSFNAKVFDAELPSLEVMTRIIVVENESRTVQAFGNKFIVKKGRVFGNNVSVGYLLAKSYGLSVGQELYAKIDGASRKLSIVAIHRIGGELDLYILTFNHSIHDGAQYVLRSVNGTEVFMDTAGFLGGEVLSVATTFFTLFSLITAVAIGINLHRLGLSLVKVLKELYITGFPWKTLLLFYYATCCIVVLIGWILGSALGLAFIQSSTYILRFLGLVVLVKPFLKPVDLVVIASVVSVPLALVPGVVWRIIRGSIVED